MLCDYYVQNIYVVMIMQNLCLSVHCHTGILYLKICKIIRLSTLIYVKGIKEYY